MTDKKPETATRKTLSLKSLESDMKESAENTSGRLASIEDTMVNMSETFAAQVGDILKAVSAKNVPVSISKDGVDCRDVYEGEDRIDIEFKKDDNPENDVETVRPGLMSVHSIEFQEKADQMRFDEEEVQIMVMPSSSMYPDHTFTIGVNGRLRLIVRGAKQWLPRKYVEVLLRAKTSTYGNFEQRNVQTNELEVKNPETKSHRYPLQILQDKNPKGAHWLNRVSNDITVA